MCTAKLSNKLIHVVNDYDKYMNDAMEIIRKYLLLKEKSILNIGSYSYEEYTHIKLEGKNLLVVDKGEIHEYNSYLHSLDPEKFESTMIDTIKCIEDTDMKGLKKILMEMKLEEGD